MADKRIVKVKGNPASHRMSNDKLKAKRARSWANGQKKKVERMNKKAEREKVNKLLRNQDLPTPWERSKRARRAKRTNLQVRK